MLDLTLTLVLTLIALLGWGGNILGMPGNWLIVATSIACALGRPETSSTHVAWGTVLAILTIAIVGELLEFAAGALGARRMGGSRRGAVLAVGGSIVGAITGLFAGTLIPIPIVGNLIASLLLGAAGAFAGASVGERWAGKDWDTSFQIGGAAFWGRLLGTVGKTVCGAIACGLFLAAIWW